MTTKIVAGIIVFVLSFIITTSIGPKPLANKVIVLDPGHGGVYPGAIANNVREADINLAVALKARERLVMSGAKVIMTRTGDNNLTPVGSTLTSDLKARVEIAKTSGADIFISFHADSSPDANIRGVTSYYPTGRPFDLALALQTSSVKKTSAINKGVRPANFYVLMNNDMPAVLIEMGFLTNPTEADRLMDNTYQDRLADGICKGIISYFHSGNTHHD
jgi:N-acetylmuramoyl-L-alanine amidase